LYGFDGFVFFFFKRVHFLCKFGSFPFNEFITYKKKSLECGVRGGSISQAIPKLIAGLQLV
jgi:hypothetical protein